MMCIQQAPKIPMTILEFFKFNKFFMKVIMSTTSDIKGIPKNGLNDFWCLLDAQHVKVYFVSNDK